jgi:hypothetical protein
MRRLVFLAACGGLVAAAFGCGLLDSVTTFTVDTDWQTFSVDTATLGLTVPSGSTIPAVPCNTSSDVCATAAASIKCTGPGYSCKVACGTGGTCGVSATAEVKMPIDLSQSSQMQGKALSKVSLTHVVLRVEANTLTFKSPQVDLYVGPAGATKTTDPGVVLFASLPSLPKSGDTDVPTTAAGNDALAGFVKSYQTPFTMLAKPSLAFAGGDPLPQGLVTVKVKAFFEVQPLK